MSSWRRTAYQAEVRDFTDAYVRSRADVTVGTGVVGLVTLPLDGGARLRAGWRGALCSMPELAFTNVRKGSLVFIPRGAPPEA